MISHSTKQDHCTQWLDIVFAKAMYLLLYNTMQTMTQHGAPQPSLVSSYQTSFIFHLQVENVTHDCQVFMN